MIEQGIVRSVEAGRARIEVISGSPEACASCGSCESGSGSESRILELSAAPELVPGRRVVLEVPEPEGLGPAVVVFLLPVLALVVGAGLGAMMPTWTEWAFLSATGFGFFGAVALLLPALFIVRRYDRALERRRSRPRLVRVEG